METVPAVFIPLHPLHNLYLFTSAGKQEPAKATKVDTVPTVFIPFIEEAVQEYVGKWQDRDEGANFVQRYDAELVKEELRPLVFEEIRLQVDEEMRVLLQVRYTK